MESTERLGMKCSSLLQLLSIQLPECSGLRYWDTYRQEASISCITCELGSHSPCLVHQKPGPGGKWKAQVLSSPPRNKLFPWVFFFQIVTFHLLNVASSLGKVDSISTQKRQKATNHIKDCTVIHLCVACFCSWGLNPWALALTCILSPFYIFNLKRGSLWGSNWTWPPQPPTCSPVQALLSPGYSAQYQSTGYWEWDRIG